MKVYQAITKTENGKVFYTAGAEICINPVSVRFIAKITDVTTVLPSHLSSKECNISQLYIITMLDGRTMHVLSSVYLLDKVIREHLSSLRNSHTLIEKENH